MTRSSSHLASSGVVVYYKVLQLFWNRQYGLSFTVQISRVEGARFTLKISSELNGPTGAVYFIFVMWGCVRPAAPLKGITKKPGFRLFGAPETENWTVRTWGRQRKGHWGHMRVPPKKTGPETSGFLLGLPPG